MFSNILRGIGGEYELNRVIGAFGAAAYVVSALTFEGWDVIWKDRPFDITAFCLAFPAGLGVAVGSVAAAVAVKDRSVATNTIMKDTGQKPGTAADGVQDVQVVNKPSAPVPTKDTQP